ncbi:MAG TPA: ferritin family protein, partial [bacterium]|nr:ferritin family protein [bacterium]
AGAHEEHDDDDIAALKKAIEFESKGADLYAKLADSSTNPMEKSFFSFLAGIEREHHGSLADALAYLENPEDYMMRQGRGGLDGA